MNKAITLGIVAAAALGGCATREEQLRQLADSLHSTPLVTAPFDSRVVAVSPDPVVLNLKVAGAQITWLAPVGFTFPTEARALGIEILGLVVDGKGEPVDLRKDPNALKAPSIAIRERTSGHFECKVSETRATCVPGAGLVKNGVYRYVIRLRDKDGKILVGDPNVVPNS